MPRGGSSTEPKRLGLTARAWMPPRIRRKARASASCSKPEKEIASLRHVFGADSVSAPQTGAAMRPLALLLFVLLLLPIAASQCTPGAYCPPVNCSRVDLLVLPCAPGFNCPENGYPRMCPERNYCPDGVTILECPEDSYCPQGSVQPVSTCLRRPSALHVFTTAQLALASPTAAKVGIDTSSGVPSSHLPRLRCSSSARAMASNASLRAPSRCPRRRLVRVRTATSLSSCVSTTSSCARAARRSSTAPLANSLAARYYAPIYDESL